MSASEANMTSMSGLTLPRLCPEPVHRERLHRRPRQDGPLRQHVDSGQGPHATHRNHHGRPEGRRPVQVRSSRPNQELLFYVMGVFGG